MTEGISRPGELISIHMKNPNGKMCIISCVVTLRLLATGIQELIPLKKDTENQKRVCGF